MSALFKDRPKRVSTIELENMTREELIEKIIQLDAHNLQLRNIINKQNFIDGGRKASTTKRQFDFSKSYKRHVLLKFMYFGWEYQGFAVQEDTHLTIEHHVFVALKKTCLIQSRETSNYNRCGRTDKGVSAFSQVISIDLRSKFSEEEQMTTENITNEIDYCSILNRVLPSNIRCISWMPLRSKIYSARFDCVQRTYRYIFPRGNLNIKKMKEACRFLIGTYDFRNLCKMDVANGVTNFVRTITSAQIKKCHPQEISDPGYEMYYLEIIGKSFLWHQIRCTMAVLLLIGEELESPTVIAELLDVNKNPCKPQYTLALGLPLNLYSCEFCDKTIQNLQDNETLCDEQSGIPDTTEWIYKKDNIRKVIENLQNSWSLSNIQSTMMRDILSDLEEIYNIKFGETTFKSQASVLQQGVRQKQYQKLLVRNRCESLETRIAHYAKKRRVAVLSPNID